MKKIIWIIVVIAIMLAGCVLYFGEIIHNGVAPQENLLKFLVLEFMMATSLARSLKKTDGKRKNLSFYERNYAEQIGRAFESDPKLRKKLLAATRFYNENNFDRAIPLLKELRRECRNTHDKQAVMLFTALCYSDSGQINAAISEYEKLVEENEQHNTALGNLAILYMNCGKYAEAERLYQKAIHLAPEDGLGYHNLASLYYRMRDYDRAISYAEQALEKKQNLYQASALLSIIYALRDDGKNSQKYFELAVASGQNAKNLRATIDGRLAEREEIKRFEQKLANTSQRFDGDIIITDPSYIVEKDEDWERCNHGEDLAALGVQTYLTFGRGDCVGTDIINSDTDELLGEFDSDSCQVSVLSLPELLAYNPSALGKLDPSSYTLIRDFHGTVHAETVKDDDDQYWKLVGEGNIHFESAPA